MAQIYIYTYTYNWENNCTNACRALRGPHLVCTCKNCKQRLAFSSRSFPSSRYCESHLSDTLMYVLHAMSEWLEPAVRMKRQKVQTASGSCWIPELMREFTSDKHTRAGIPGQTKQHKYSGASIPGQTQHKHSRAGIPGDTTKSYGEIEIKLLLALLFCTQRLKWWSFCVKCFYQNGQLNFVFVCLFRLLTISVCQKVIYCLRIHPGFRRQAR